MRGGGPNLNIEAGTATILASATWRSATPERRAHTGAFDNVLLQGGSPEPQYRTALITLAEYEGDGVGAVSRLQGGRNAVSQGRPMDGYEHTREQHAGALETLAEAIRSIRPKFYDEAHRVEEIAFIEVTLGIYSTLGDEDSVGRIRNRIHGEWSR